MSTRLPGFKGEYLWEFDIAERQLLALAEAFPPETYGWRSAGTARSVSEVLVHVAAGNLTLLGIVGVEAAPDLYGKLEGEIVPRMMAMIAKNDCLEKSKTDKAAVIALLRRSLDAVRTAFTQAPDFELDRQDVFLGERTTVRRVYMRGLTHMHEHMGQLIAYTRAMGMPAPWPDWRESGRKIIESGEATLRK
ncbi:MAG: DinB family protein [Candidatus Sulfotelmatobacter sp.]|jgi:uncharacterized damage-inducible protein DinB